jgi:3-oxoacyl-[acyl-carrier-protein] synthase-1/3-oxoacyl-[acyl-carrier-protein] synthase II
VAIVAMGAVSALGRGERAIAVGAPGERPCSRVADDPELARAGLKKPRTARVPSALLPPESDRARSLLSLAAEDLAAELELTLPGWRGRRLGVLVGTSAGGLPSLERALAAHAAGGTVDGALARASFYDGPLAVLSPVFGHAARTVSVLGACAASTLAVGLGARMLEAGDVELVVAGGYDALCAFLAVGFEALGATTAREPLPFQRARDGMALGEGAALVAMVRAHELGERRAPHGYVLGFGATSDATHVTAPDPSGQGLAAAARAALADAALPASSIDVVSAHATATPHNDSAESQALASIFGDELPSVVVHPFKAVVGHALGAAGALDALATLGALARGVLPAAPPHGALDASFGARLLAENQRTSGERCLKLSAAFGGTNAALVLGTGPRGAGTARPRRRVLRLVEGPRVTAPDLELVARHTRLDEVRRARLERASALAVTAVARALESLDSRASLAPSTTGVVVGTVAASLEANELFDARRREPGVSVEPRRFPATSPNLPAGVCSIAFDFRGPALAVGGVTAPMEEAFALATELIAAGDAEHVVVVACDDVGPTTRMLAAAARVELPEDGARAVVLGPAP